MEMLEHLSRKLAPPESLKPESSKPSGPLENNAEQIERIRSSASGSIEELQGLVSELQKLQEFLQSGVDSVQRQIESALAGINIIVETIGPWKSIQPPARPEIPEFLQRSSFPKK